MTNEIVAVQQRRLASDHRNNEHNAGLQARQ